MGVRVEPSDRKKLLDHWGRRTSLGLLRWCSRRLTTSPAALFRTSATERSNIAVMTSTAALLASLDVIAHETTRMLRTLDAAQIASDDRREARRRVLEIQARTQELFDWLSEARLEEPTN